MVWSKKKLEVTILRHWIEGNEIVFSEISSSLWEPGVNTPNSESQLR